MTVNPSDYFPADWLEDAAELDRARREELAESTVFVTKRRYVRESAVDADLFAYNLATLGGFGVRYPDGYFRIVIPGTKRPDVLARHLERVADGLEFILVRETVDDSAD